MNQFDLEKLFREIVWFGSASFQCPSISVFIQYYLGNHPNPAKLRLG